MAGGRAAVTAALVALVLVTLSSSLIGGKVFTSGDNIFLWPPFAAERPAGFVRPSNPLLTDPVVGLNPDLLQTRADLRNGTLPLWNPDAAAGRPLLASQVHAPLFPISWLAFLLPFWSSLAWIAAAKLLLAATGVYLFCRELALRRGPSLLGAVAFAFGTYFFVWLEHPQTNVWALLPWMFFATRRVCTRGSLGDTALLALAGGLSWFGGHPESAGFLLAASAAYGAFELIAERTRGPSSATGAEGWSGPGAISTIGGRAGLLIGGLGLGVGMSAILNAPLFELLGQSATVQRGGPAAPFRLAFSFVFPELWGMPSKAFSGAGPSNFNERTAYIGALPLILALGSIGRRRPREQWFFVGMGVVVLATVLNTPFWASAVRKLPEGNVAALWRLLIIVSFTGAVLAAYGLQRWITGTNEDRRRMLWVMGVAALLPPLLWLPRHLDLLSHLWAAMGQLPAVHPSEKSSGLVALGSVWRWIVICALGLGALALTRRRRSPTLAVVLIVLLTGADLVALDRGYHGSIPLADANPPVPATIRYLQSHQGDARMIGSGIALPSNLAERYGLRDARVAIDIPYPRRYSQLWTGLGGIGGDQEFFVSQAPVAQRLADLFGARYALLSPGEPVPPWLHPVFKSTDGTVAVNPTALPRAWVAYNWRDARGATDALRTTLTSSSRQWRDEPVIEGAPTPPTGPAQAATVAQVIHDGAEGVTVQAVAGRPGYVVLDDSAYPGWQATLDGRAVHWLAANEGFRAVAVPPGRHLVSFRYRPASVLVGAIVTGLSMLAMLGLALLGARWVRRSRLTATEAQDLG